MQQLEPCYSIRKPRADSLPAYRLIALLSAWPSFGVVDIVRLLLSEG